MHIDNFFGENIGLMRVGKKPILANRVVSADQVPLHLSQWNVICADKSKSRAAVAEYERLMNKAGKREVEVMRLGLTLLNEVASTAALNTSPSCAKYCSSQEVWLSDSLRESTSNILCNICLHRFSAPTMNWNEICI